VLTRYGYVMTSPIQQALAAVDEKCPDCLLPFAKGKQTASTEGVCASWTQQGRHACDHRTVARLRSELASARAQVELTDAPSPVAGEPQHPPIEGVSGSVLQATDLRVFHLHTELAAVSREAKEHAEARAQLLAQLTTAQSALEQANARVKEEGCRKHHLIHCSVCQGEALLRSARARADAAEHAIEQTDASRNEALAKVESLKAQLATVEKERDDLKSLPSGKWFKLIRMAAGSPGLTSWAELNGFVRSLVSGEATWREEAARWTESSNRNHRDCIKAESALAEANASKYLLIAENSRLLGELQGVREGIALRDAEHARLLAEANARAERLELERPHLLEGARLLLASHELGLVRDTAYGAALDRWLTAERVRLAQSPKQAGEPVAGERALKVGDRVRVHCRGSAYNTWVGRISRLDEAFPQAPYRCDFGDDNEYTRNFAAENLELLPPATPEPVSETKGEA
jgi:hypothetical protein